MLVRIFLVQGNMNAASKHLVGVGTLKPCVEGLVELSQGREIGSEHASWNGLFGGVQMTVYCRGGAVGSGWLPPLLIAPP